MLHISLSVRPSDLQSFHMGKNQRERFASNLAFANFFKGLEKIQIASKSDKSTGHFI